MKRRGGWSGDVSACDINGEAPMKKARLRQYVPRGAIGTRVIPLDRDPVRIYAASQHPLSLRTLTAYSADLERGHLVGLPPHPISTDTVLSVLSGLAVGAGGTRCAGGACVALRPLRSERTGFALWSALALRPGRTLRPALTLRTALTLGPLQTLVAF